MEWIGTVYGVYVRSGVIFKEWLPDIPPLENQGLIRAENVYPRDGSYAALPTATTGAALPSTPLGGISFVHGSPNAFGALIGTSSLLMRLQTSGSFATAGSGYTALASAGGSSYWRFAQFDDVIVATNGLDAVQRLTIGASVASTLGSASGNAPVSAQVGVINKFLFLGDLSTDPFAVQWSGLDDPNSYPTPNSSTAIAQQSGLQVMPATGGTVTGISSGDQFGVIFQRNRISRASYVGPPVVFQFDTIDDSRGCFFPNSLVEVGTKTYFAAAFGFFVTDGVSVEPISDGRCSHRFFDSQNYMTSSGLYGAVDYEKKCIFWTFGSSMAIYNYVENRWSYSTAATEFIMSGIAPT